MSSTSTETKPLLDPRPAALVTGCSEPKSLGTATARALHQRGYKVFATARRPETLNHLAADGMQTLQLDVTDCSSIKRAASRVEAEAGRLDVLVNNAGQMGASLLLDTDLDALRRMFDTNLFGALAVTQAFAPLMAQTASRGVHRAPHSGPPVIVNIGSAASWGMPFQGGYGASKAALQCLSDSLRMEAGVLGLQVMTVELLGTKTAITTGTRGTSLRRSTPSGLYNVEVDAHDTFSKFLVTSGKQYPSPDKVAKDLVAAVSRSSPPPKVWLGLMAWIFRWVLPLLPVFLLDAIFWKALPTEAIQPAVPASGSKAIPDAESEKDPSAEK